MTSSYIALHKIKPKKERILTMVQWTCMGVETSLPWPGAEKKYFFESHELILRPETETLSPSIAFEHGSKGISASDARTIIRRFMSALVYLEGFILRETYAVGGSFPIGIGKSPFRNGGQNPVFDYHYLPAPQEPEKKRALAFYREAICNNSIFYKFLGFVKIINIIAKTKTEHANWINANLCHITELRALKKINSFKTTNTDIGMHVYKSGRCAIAHAYGQGELVVDPDSSEDVERLTEELPLVQALATVVLEKELGMPSLRTIYREHLYELKGFKEKFSANFLEEITSGVMRPVLPQEINMNLSVGIRNKEPYDSMNYLQIKEALMNKGVLSLWLSTIEGAIQFAISLDFKNNLLLMDPYVGAEIAYFGTKQAAGSIRGFYQFMLDLFKNGKLQVEEAESRYILGYKDSFIPQDIDLNRTIKNLKNVIDSLDKEMETYKS